MFCLPLLIATPGSAGESNAIAIFFKPGKDYYYLSVKNRNLIFQKHEVKSNVINRVLRLYSSRGVLC
jgi:hypothetical protein